MIRAGIPRANPAPARALAADGGVVPMRGPGEAFDEGLDVRPKIQALEDGVHLIRDRAIIGVLRIGVLEPVLARILEDGHQHDLEGKQNGGEKHLHGGWGRWPEKTGVPEE